MHRFVLNLVTAGLVLASAGTAAAQNAHLYAVHGIPGGDLGLSAALPVDVSVNGACALTDFRFGQVRGPLSLPPGNYTFEIKLNLGGEPCTGPTAIGPAVIPLAAGENATVIAHLTAGGAPTASKFVNDVSNTRAGRARIVAHHTAAAPAVDVYVGRKLSDPTAPALIVPGVVNGDQAGAPLQPGNWQAALKLAGTDTVALGPATVRLRPFTAYFVYAVGSASTGSLTFIVNAIDSRR
ncbi:hypothetical protein TBR22_A11120 [Luteitalea sp. TBR-22]|uniref:DUF4397 domain-containing protein n=1 Tax=Luteitalea sp. TBR-22 TaxID=2802971 RepID=UPI001AFA4ED7|nr:DUF4397 domain-containing protein [Luteitalea sp. TBR-22]BCS31909.1 hypothetical protein TBR22_A11120 [Luteitalea sp. TBR-22]